jgi:hypothetical protein
VIGALLLVSALQQDPGYGRAESLLAAQDLPQARATAQRLVDRHARDARAHLLLGRVWYAWPVTGRFEALRQFRIAARLAPGDPEPLAWQVRVGEYLRSDDGERIMREALLKLLALPATDGASWSQFRSLFHSLGILRDADAALAAHGDDPTALAHRAELALEAEAALRADSLAARALERRRPNVSAYIVRAQANFEAGQRSAGYAWYDSALAHAERDSTEELWRSVRMIATPDEVARYRAIPPRDRQEFFEQFWHVRDPNLVTPVNERIPEHFERLAHARREFRLLHPWASVHHSSSRRTLGEVASAEEVTEMLADPGLDLPTEDITDTVSRQLPPPSMLQGDDYFVSGLDARGILWVRHGKPTVMANAMLDALSMTPRPPGIIAPVESWLYETPEFTADIAFIKSGGDFMVAPISHRQRGDLYKVARLFRTDATSVPAPLQAHAWTVFFASPGQTLRTDVYCKAVPDTAAAALWTAGDLTIDRARGPGLLRLTAPPGTYQLALDVDSAGVLGRARQVLHVPAFGSGALRLSSLALAPGDSLVDRETSLRAMPADLVYPAGEPLVAYAEIYGFPGGDPVARYTARYTFTPMDAGRPTVFTFVRERPAQATLVEQIVIEPGRIPSGRYRVAVAITTPSGAIETQTTSVEIVIR